MFYDTVGEMISLGNFHNVSRHVLYNLFPPHNTPIIEIRNKALDSGMLRRSVAPQTH